MADVVYRSICTENGLEVPRSEWKTPPKVIENEWAKVLWDLQIETDKLVKANQPDIVFIDKQQKKAVVTDVSGPSRYQVQHLSIVVYLSIVDAHGHSLISSNGYFQLDNAPCHKAKVKQTGFKNVTVSSVNFSGLPSHQIGIQQIAFEMWLNGRLAAWLCSRQICSSWFDTIMSRWTKISKFQTYCEIYGTENWGQY